MAAVLDIANEQCSFCANHRELALTERPIVINGNPLATGVVKMETSRKIGGIEQGKDELDVTRVIKAPRVRLWKAWTDHARIKRWWESTDRVAGGTHLAGGGGHSPPWERSRRARLPAIDYREDEEAIRLDCRFASPATAGGETHARYSRAAAGQMNEVSVEVTFCDVPNGTRVAVKQKGLTDKESRRRAGTYWNDALQRLEVEMVRIHVKKEPRVQPRAHRGAERFRSWRDRDVERW